MIYFVWIIKILIIILAVGWASYVPGEITLDWQDYIIKFSLRTYVGFSVTLLILLLTLYDAYKDLYNRIRSRLERNTYLRLLKFQEKLIQGFIDLELQNSNLVDNEVNFLKSKYPQDLLSLYYQYRVATTRNDQENLDKLIAKLQLNPILKPLALKIQIRQAISMGNTSLAFKLTEEALKLMPSAWFYKSAVFLSIGNKKYEKALEYLREGGRLYSFEKGYENYLFSIIWYQFAKHLGPDQDNYVEYLQKAHEYNLSNPQPSLLLAKYFAENDQMDRAKKTLLETWKSNSNSYLVARAYADLGSAEIEQAQLASDLYKQSPEAPIAALVLILKYINAKLWGEAQKALKKFTDKYSKSHSSEINYLNALMTHDEKGENEKAYEMLNSLLQQKLKRKWSCKFCGYESEAWQAFCESCSKFDHLEYAEVAQNPLLLPFIP